MLPCRNALPAPCMYVGLVPKYPSLRPPCEPLFKAPEFTAESKSPKSVVSPPVAILNC